VKAGRELDALVAEKVMGYKTAPIPDGETANPPNFSTDITAAWQVVEKMRERGYRLGLRTWVRSAEGEAVFVDPKRERASEGNGAFDASVPLAICIAALRAVGAL
jgi:hypothetical protein